MQSTGKADICWPEPVTAAVAHVEHAGGRCEWGVAAAAAVPCSNSAENT